VEELAQADLLARLAALVSQVKVDREDSRERLAELVTEDNQDCPGVRAALASKVLQEGVVYQVGQEVEARWEALVLLAAQV